jgi:hypothetical protein
MARVKTTVAKLKREQEIRKNIAEFRKLLDSGYAGDVCNYIICEYMTAKEVDELLFKLAKRLKAVRELLEETLTDNILNKYDQ